MANGNFGGGNGTAENPYLVEDAHDLDAVRNYLGNTSVHFLQVADIDLSSWGNWKPIACEQDANMFYGTYDGNGYKILNMRCHYNEYYVGLFGQIVSATIKNTFIESGNVSGRINVGGLVGYAETSTISNCYASGNVSGDGDTGGLIGHTDSSTISNCYASGDVSGRANVGGLVGYAETSTISNCYASGNVSGEYLLGGLIGYDFESTITNCYASGDVSGEHDTGGLIGQTSFSTISNCYASGNVSGELDTGGLIGHTGFSTISNCYASGNVSGSENVGGLLGFDFESTISGCYALNSFITILPTYTDPYFGDIAGDYYDSTIENCYSLDTLDVYISMFGERQGTPITEKQAKQRQTYENLTGWDFEKIWEINEGVDYPRLIKKSRSQTHCKAFIRQAGKLILTPVSG